MLAGGGARPRHDRVAIERLGSVIGQDVVRVGDILDLVDLARDRSNGLNVLGHVDGGRHCVECLRVVGVRYCG